MVEFHNGHGAVPCFDARCCGRSSNFSFAHGAAACGQRRLGRGGVKVGPLADDSMISVGILVTYE